MDFDTDTEQTGDDSYSGDSGDSSGDSDYSDDDSNYSDDDSDDGDDDSDDTNADDGSDYTDGGCDDGSQGGDEASSADTADDGIGSYDTGGFGSTSAADGNVAGERTYYDLKPGESLNMEQRVFDGLSAFGGLLTDGYNRAAALYDRVTGDDAAADRRSDDAEAYGDYASRDLHEAIGGKKIAVPDSVNRMFEREREDERKLKGQ